MVLGALETREDPVGQVNERKNSWPLLRGRDTLQRT